MEFLVAELWTEFYIHNTHDFSLHSVVIPKLFMAQNQRSKSQQRQVHADLYFDSQGIVHK